MQSGCEVVGRADMKRTAILSLLVTLVGLAEVSETPAAPPDGATRPIDIGSQKQLLLDRHLVKTSRDVKWTMHSPRRDGRILIRADQPWEKGCHVLVYSSVIRDGGKVRIWYDLLRQYGPGPYDHERGVAYAESVDGIHFTKPRLGLHEWAGTKENNIVIPSKIGGCAVWIDERAEPEHRYKTQAKVYPTGQFHMHSSPDGLKWSLYSKPAPGPGGHDTQSIVFWDPAVKRYALYTRYWAHNADRKRRFRTVRRMETDDLKRGHWDKQTIVMAPDDRDRATHKMPGLQPPVDFYGAAVFPYHESPGLTLMLSQPHWHWQPRLPLKGLGPANLEVQLAASRDGRQFERLGDRRPFMANGPDGAFDSRYVWALPNPIRMGDELWIYYGGNNRDHDGHIDTASPAGKQQTGIGRAVLRLDGFVSIDAGPRGGVLTTPAVTFSGDRLELNVKTGGGGAVEVAILDAQGKSIPGFARSDCITVTGNSVRMPVSWKGSPDLSRLAGKPVRLRFHVRDCELYAFQFRPGVRTSAASREK